MTLITALLFVTLALLSMFVWMLLTAEEDPFDGSAL